MNNSAVGSKVKLPEVVIYKTLVYNYVSGVELARLTFVSLKT